MKGVTFYVKTNNSVIKIFITKIITMIFLRGKI